MIAQGGYCCVTVKFWVFMIKTQSREDKKTKKQAVLILMFVGLKITIKVKV